MSCPGQYADANDFSTFFCSLVNEEEEANLNRILRLAATRISMARQASGACDCTLSTTSIDYLKYLNCILAIVFYNCKCTNLNVTQEMRAMYLEAATKDLELIRTGKLELCQGETGSDFPWTGWAEQGWTEANRAQIVVNDALRNS